MPYKREEGSQSEENLENILSGRPAETHFLSGTGVPEPLAWKVREKDTPAQIKLKVEYSSYILSRRVGNMIWNRDPNSIKYYKKQLKAFRKKETRKGARIWLRKFVAESISWEDR